MVHSNTDDGVTAEQILGVLAGIDDPEMPISIIDLGIVVNVQVAAGTACVTLTPTFTGCPALQMIDDQVRAAVSAIEGIDHVQLEHVFDPPWSSDRISAAGRERLGAHGIAVSDPARVQLHISSRSTVPCPFCGSPRTRVDSPFGVTRCRAIHYCDGCRNSFEHIKRNADVR
jgi:ring-1,2-phenylacetyl-CoA epoxidase subunit PaaD